MYAFELCPIEIESNVSNAISYAQFCCIKCRIRTLPFQQCSRNTHTHIPDPPQCLKIPSFRYAEKFQQKKMERKKDYMKSRSRPLTLHGRYAFVPICAVTFVIP